ncbi:hypothetical protein H0H81_002614 [Sphagnurus paluster]|uniref:Uncharacterized protein n=1 Tax=Sphagnurus paluster TaxID=117069 RepID=A0A9P7GS68_9AGAR|nr:hypothetical protein H0H81_002614 [Sphagnurus paluster]
MVSSDARNYHAHRMNSMAIRTLTHYIYPQVMALHDLEDDVALPDQDGHTRFPVVMRDSHMFMEAHGLYVAGAWGNQCLLGNYLLISDVENEESTIFWVGNSVSPQLLTDLFGVDDVLSLDPRLCQLPVLDTRLSIQVRNILTYRRLQRGGRLTRMYIARQNLDASEIEFSDMLVEDQNNGNMSYTDCKPHCLKFAAYSYLL